MAKKGVGTVQNNVDAAHPYEWVPATVANILSKPEYMGHTVNFRSHKESYKDKKPVLNPSEEWLIFENAHEAIIDKETWELAQKLRNTKRCYHDRTGGANPLTGLVYCADCGEKMYNHRHKTKAKNGVDPVTGLYPFDHYECSSYARTNMRGEISCCSHYISTKALRGIILDTIRLVSRYAIDNKADFIKNVKEASKVKELEEAKSIQKKLRRDKKRYNELDVIIKKLYESYATGRITGNRFDTLCAEYEQEQAELKVIIERKETEITEYTEDKDRIKQFLELAKKYTDFSVLTVPMINEFIDKIIVHKPDKSSGEREQEIEIYLKFIGKFDVPMPEPTAEELKKMKKARIERQKNRERARKCREQKKKAELARRGQSA